MKIDLGGIAKGYTSSKVMDIFKENGRTIGKVQLKYFADKVQNNFDIIKREIDKSIPTYPYSHRFYYTLYPFYLYKHSIYINCCLDFYN